MNNILLIGNPNVGKSSIFNLLTGSHEHTGNWTGKTVESCSARIKKTNYNLIDLPGIYSLSSLSEEEIITRDVLLFSEYKKIIYVMNVSNIERNMNLLLQLLEINSNIILCLNMIDELNQNNIQIDTNLLSDILGIDVICTSTKNNIGFNELINSLDKDKKSNYKYLYSYYVENNMNELNKIMNLNNRFLLHSVLQKDNTIIKYLKKKIDKNVNNYLLNVNREKISDDICFKINDLSNEIIKRVIIRKDNKKVSVLDKLSTNKICAFVSMLTILFGIFFITIILANYPSELLGYLFNKIHLYINSFTVKYSLHNNILLSLIDNVYIVVSFIISVMFPPLVIFFFLFTYTEEIGLLPRIVFNLDKICNKCNCHGKQVLTICSGFGCNACAISNSRIIDSKRDKLIAILTNSFIPCNGRFPIIITIISMFLVNDDNKLITALYLSLFVILTIAISFIISYILSKTILKGYPGFFILEMPKYKKVKITKILKNSLIYKSLSILKKAIIVSIPAGIIIWIFNNISINSITIYSYFTNMLNPFAKLIGLDGVILSSFILGLPANEIVLPLMMMGYTNSNQLLDISNIDVIKNILLDHGWNIKVAISTILFTIMHFPCATTLYTIKSEVGIKWMIYSFLIPLITGIFFLLLFNLII